MNRIFVVIGAFVVCYLIVLGLQAYYNPKKGKRK